MTTSYDEDMTAISATVEEWAEDHPTIGWQVAGETIELTARPSPLCKGCGQELSAQAPSVAWYDDDGRVQGDHSQQHGCGAWNAPRSVECFIGDEVDLAHIGQILDQTLGGLVEMIECDREDILAGIRQRLTDDLADALAADVDGFEPTGSETEPGVYQDGGEWIAWAYVPWGDGEIIDVTDEDGL